MGRSASSRSHRASSCCRRLLLLADDVPAADAAEQQKPADDNTEDPGFDLRCVADLLQRDANPSDVIDQAIIVSIPDDDRDVDTSLF